jgi:hypothetical protein
MGGGSALRRSPFRLPELENQPVADPCLCQRFNLRPDTFLEDVQNYQDHDGPDQGSQQWDKRIDQRNDLAQKTHSDIRVNNTPKRKGHIDFSMWPLFTPATTGFYPERSQRIPTHFRVQYNRPSGLT